MYWGQKVSKYLEYFCKQKFTHNIKKIAQSLLTISQSGEISPNLVTLIIVVSNLKIAYFILIKNRGGT